MKYVKRVVSSLKQGCDVQLGLRTVIVGPNKGGKSTIIQALELATCGYANDVEGRNEVKAATTLSRLFPPDKFRFAKVVFSDGTPFSWELPEGKKPGSVGTAIHKAPFTIDLTLDSLAKTLRGDVKSLKGWLEDKVIGEQTEDDVLSLVAPDDRVLVARLMQRHKTTDFISLSKVASSSSRSLKLEATKKEKIVERMLCGVSPPLTQKKIDVLKAEMAELAPETLYSEAARNALAVQVEVVSKRRDMLSREVSRLPKLDQARKDVVTTLLNARHVHKVHDNLLGQDRCWVCGNTKKEDILAQQKLLSQAIKEVKPLYDLHERREVGVRELAELDSGLAQLVQQLKSMDGASSDSNVRRAEIRALLAEDRATCKTWANAKTIRSEVVLSRAQAEELTALAKSLAVTGTKRLEQKKAAFLGEVSAYLPEDEAMGVDLKAARVGLKRGDSLHSAVSGAEWSSLLLALASASAKNQSTTSILIPEDKSWDRVMLTRVMEALSFSPVQIILMSTVQPELVEGWTCLNL